MNRRWKRIRENLSQILRISPEILDFLADYDIILDSVSGISNSDICSRFGIPKKDVEKVIYLNIGVYVGEWKGFEKTSKVSPYPIFKSMANRLGRVPTELEFTTHISSLCNIKSEFGITPKRLYKIILTFTTERFRILSLYRKEDYDNSITKHAQ